VGEVLAQPLMRSDNKELNFGRTGVPWRAALEFTD